MITQFEEKLNNVDAVQRTTHPIHQHDTTIPIYKKKKTYTDTLILNHIPRQSL